MANKNYTYVEVDVKKTDKTAIQIMNDMGEKGFRLVPMCRLERLLYFEK